MDNITKSIIFGGISAASVLLALNSMIDITITSNIDLERRMNANPNQNIYAVAKQISKEMPKEPSYLAVVSAISGGVTAAMSVYYATRRKEE